MNQLVNCQQVLRYTSKFLKSAYHVSDLKNHKIKKSTNPYVTVILFQR